MRFIFRSICNRDWNDVSNIFFDWTVSEFDYHFYEMTSTKDTTLCPSLLMSGAMSRNRITSGPVEVGVYRL